MNDYQIIIMLPQYSNLQPLNFEEQVPPSSEANLSPILDLQSVQTQSLGLGCSAQAYVGCNVSVRGLAETVETAKTLILAFRIIILCNRTNYNYRNEQPIIHTITHTDTHTHTHTLTKLIRMVSKRSAARCRHVTWPQEADQL